MNRSTLKTAGVCDANKSCMSNLITVCKVSGTVKLALTALQPIRWQDSNAASNPEGKQASCATGLSFA